jgi:hypothetical protein
MTTDSPGVPYNDQTGVVTLATGLGNPVSCDPALPSFLQFFIGGPAELTLSGTTTPILLPDAHLSLAPNPLDYGELPVGTSKTLTVTFSDSGTNDTLISSTQIAAGTRGVRRVRDRHRRPAPGQRAIPVPVCPGRIKLHHTGGRLDRDPQVRPRLGRGRQLSPAADRRAGRCAQRCHYLRRRHGDQPARRARSSVGPPDHYRLLDGGEPDEGVPQRTGGRLRSRRLTNLDH